MKGKRKSFLIWLVLSGIMFGCTKTETVLAPAEDHVITLTLGFVSPVESELNGENILDVTIKDSAGASQTFTLDNPESVITPAGVCYRFKKDISLSMVDEKTPLWIRGLYRGFPEEVTSYWPSQDVSPYITVDDHQPYLAKDGWMYVEVSCAGDINLGGASIQGFAQNMSSKSWLWVGPTDPYIFPDSSVVHISMKKAVTVVDGIVMQPILCNSDWSVGVNVPTSRYQHRIMQGGYWGLSAQTLLPSSGGIIAVQAVLSSEGSPTRRVTEILNTSGLGQSVPDDLMLAPGYRLFWVYPGGYGVGGKG